ncbi:MAG: hypothetical protein ACP5DC_11585 [Halothiobacillaceae bacterium]
MIGRGGFLAGMFAVILAGLPGLSVASGTTERIDGILAADPAPPGIVFDIMTPEADALDRLLPEIEGWVDYIRDRAPGMDLVVVAHGNEMFALKEDQAFIHEAAHESAARLVAGGIEVAVCGAYANMRQVDWNAFIDPVVVAESGPARVNDYRALGYEVVFVGDPNYTPRPIPVD